MLEDFGDALFADVLTQGVSEEELYKAAVEVLAKLHAGKRARPACARSSAFRL